MRVAMIMRYFPLFRSETDLEKKREPFVGTQKLWALQLDSEISDLDAKYYP